MSLKLELPFNTMSPEDVVHALVEHAGTAGASDLFLCAGAQGITARARHLGIMQSICQLPVEQGRRCLSHIKAVAGMDVAEKRRPQDGRWLARLRNGHTVDLRINILPTQFGEDITMRILDRETRLLNLEHLGLLRRDLNQMLAFLSNPSGLILVTGPTGSGKTTTLYACLNHLHNGARKINTIEDPIEYTIEGIHQSQVNTRIDVGFAQLLRSVLRQSPDVIMIGEIRDPETAEIAVRAANSGHLVLATMHAPVAAGAIPTLLNLGVHPHFLAYSLLGVLAQRLVRTLCPACQISFDVSVSPHTFNEVKRYLEPGEGEKVYGPQGCAECHMMGFKGRTGVFEVMSITPAIRRLIMERQPLQVIRSKAIEEGLIEFRLAALLAVARGVTSIEEVFRAIPMEYLMRE